MENPNLGQQCQPDAQRDAIHIAILPAIAGHEMVPGDHVSLIDGQAHTNRPDSIGIADPFLQGVIARGAKIYILLYPGTITSLRHEWTHPAIEDAAPKITAYDSISSEQWLREFCASNDMPRYEVAMEQLANEDQYDGEYFTFRHTDAHCDIPREFWDHYETVTGGKTPRPRAFSCWC